MAQALGKHPPFAYLPWTCSVPLPEPSPTAQVPRITMLSPSFPSLPAAALVLLLAVVGCGAVDRTAADRFTASGELIALSGGDAGAANACIECHGVDGLGDGGGTPRLAGLDRGYMEAQLAAYADGRRHHAAMEAIARKLDGGQRQAVAMHYAALPFTPETARPAGGAVAALYNDGDPARGLPSCASCHGEAGEGLGPANPPLGGQPAMYLAEQLDQWRQGRRRNDPANIMLEIARQLTPEESAALAAYAAELPGGPPGPESREASREARRDDPRNGASTPHPRAGG